MRMSVNRSVLSVNRLMEPSSFSAAEQKHSGRYQRRIVLKILCWLTNFTLAHGEFKLSAAS